MADSIMYQEDGYVILETNQPEQLLTREELLTKLENIVKLASNLPRDVQEYPDIKSQSEYLLDNYCEFNIDENSYLQWYVVRWEKN